MGGGSKIRWRREGRGFNITEVHAQLANWQNWLLNPAKMGKDQSKPPPGVERDGMGWYGMGLG